MPDRSRIGAFSSSAYVRWGLLWCWCVAITAHARCAGAQTAEERETARQLLDRGDEQLERGDAQQALTLYLGANEIMHVPTTGIEVARAYVALHRLVEARDTALEVLRMPNAPEEPVPFRNARVAAEQLARDLMPKIPQLLIKVTPDEVARRALYVVDGRRIPPAAASSSVALNPTEHRIEVSAPGFVTEQRTLSLTEGERRSLEVVMKKAPSQPTRDGNGEAKPESETAPKGAENDSPRRDSVDNPRAGGLPWYSWLGFGVGGTGILVGSVTGAIAFSKTHDAETHCQGNVCSASAASDIDRSLLMANISNVGFAVGIAGIGFGLTSWWLSRPAVDPPKAALRFVGIPGGGVVGLEGPLRW